MNIKFELQNLPESVLDEIFLHFCEMNVIDVYAFEISGLTLKSVSQIIGNINTRLIITGNYHKLNINDFVDDTVFRIGHCNTGSRIYDERHFSMHVRDRYRINPIVDVSLDVCVRAEPIVNNFA